jgi:hypothetical protein
MSNVQFEAAFLRAALLVGLVHERDVPAWAMERMASSAEAGSQLTDVLLAPSELTAMREALRPLGERIADDRVAAVSRQVVRDRGWSDPPGHAAARAWVIRGAGADACSLVLNEGAWLTAAREFSPIPVESRIPSLTLPVDAVEVLDGSTTAPFGADEALAKIATDDGNARHHGFGGSVPSSGGRKSARSR